jgi:hypothetical protein
MNIPQFYHNLTIVVCHLFGLISLKITSNVSHQIIITTSSVFPIVNHESCLGWLMVIIVFCGIFFQDSGFDREIPFPFADLLES